MRRGALLALVPTLFGLVAPPTNAVGATGAPSLRLRAASGHITVLHRRHQPIFVDPGVYVAPIGGTFSLHVARPDYSAPASVRQVWTDSTGEHQRPLPSAVLDGWRGLGRFLHVVVRNADGKVVRRATVTFCPNSFGPQRVKPNGPADPTFPFECFSFNPFLVSGVWGIDRGWAVDPLSAGGSFFGPFGGGIRFRGPDGTYVVTASIMPRYVGLLGVDPAKATSTVRMTVKTGNPDCPPFCGAASGSTGAGASWGRAPEVPTGPPPPQQDLPDLASLPAFGVFTFSRLGRDLLSFSTTEWVGGGSDLDVEGFRRHNSNVMDAYQYFYKDGRIVGRAPVGTMEFDDRTGHHHWHFLQFARYRLLDAGKTLAVRSHKQSFCIAPTDGVDLLLPGATLRPDVFGFVGCGTASSLWVRERMPLGWGDTYIQYLAGQAFDISKVPNGTYYIQIEVNPQDLLYEQNASNNVSLRKVVLRGSPGHRIVCLPALYGIDREGSCPGAK
jgi:hypothetical protein